LWGGVKGSRQGVIRKKKKLEQNNVAKTAFIKKGSEHVL